MSDLFDQTPTDDSDQRLRAAGWHPYSGTGKPSGYWMRAGDPRTYTTAQALAVLDATLNAGSKAPPSDGA